MTQLLADFSAYKLTTAKRMAIVAKVNGYSHISGAGFIGSELLGKVNYYDSTGSSNLTAYLNGLRDGLDRKPQPSDPAK